ncbi:hypothetical protein LOD99_15291 [Oopsacas minuta]|uniref:Uncharacterized protein n=1 Tax=Oopsacas minuta TaxID=111878 RepID=A0AAV7KAN3_9METZ|nr:hypothetical protein LOD99_15291 [Oopsacas minuta]
MNTYINIVHEQIYENTVSSPCGSPVRQKCTGYRPKIVRQNSPYGPPENAWKSVEIQDLYDERLQLLRKEEAHTIWRQETEKKLIETQEENQRLRGEMKILREENAQLLNSIHPLARTKRNVVQNIPPNNEIIFADNFMNRERIEIPHRNTHESTKFKKMSDDIKSLNLVIQQLNADKTDLIHKQDRTDEEGRLAKELVRKQEEMIREFIQRDEQKSFELSKLKTKLTNYQNENANLDLIVKENLHRIKLY